MKLSIQNQKQVFPKPAKFFRMFILSVIIGLTGMGCNLKPQPNIEVMQVWDLSMSVDSIAHPDGEKGFKHLLKQLGIDGANPYTARGIKVHFSYVGNNSRPAITTVTLERGGILKNGLDHEKEVRHFMTDLRKAYDNWLNLEATHQTSLIYCGMAYHMRLLKESRFGQEKIYQIYTDGFEAGDVVRFKDYKENPEKLRNELPEITQKLEAQCPIPDSLGNISIRMINPPTPDGDKLTRITDQFWENLFTRKGADIKIRSGVDG